MLSVESCAIPDVKCLRPRLFHDSRGFVTESFSARRFAEAGFPEPFVQENLSFSEKAGTVRGLHFQKPPHAQAKLIHVLRGRIFDVAVDLRPGSSTYGKHVHMILSEDEPVFFYIPRGFAHGFCTLADKTAVLYKVDNYYAPESEGGIQWNDPALAIDWPVSSANAVVSDKDAALPPLSTFSSRDSR